jgi:transposase InsO family protein
VARSNLIDRLKGRTKPRRRYHKAQDAAVVPLITAFVSARPTYGYRRITAVLNRQLRSDGLAPVNHKRVYRIMQAHNLLLARKYSERPEHVHDGKVIVIRSNLRSPVGLNQWRPLAHCSDGFEFTCWNGDIVRGAFIIDAHDREIHSSGKRSPGSFSDPPHTWRAVVNAGISGSDIRDIMLEAVESRFGAYRAPSVIEMLSDNGSPHIAKDTQIFARQLGLKPCFTPVQSPQSNGISLAIVLGPMADNGSPFVKTLKRNYVQVTPLPDAQTVLALIGGWIEDYNDNHPHSGLKMRSPREFISAQTATA